MAVHKKHEEKAPASAEASTDAKAMAGKEVKSEEVKTEPVIVSDVVTETTERIEIIKKVPASQAPTADPLSDFKEKMVEEESPTFNNIPKKNYMWPILLIFVLAVAFLVGVFIYGQGFKGEKVNVVTLSPTPTITPEPTKTIDLTQHEIEIQNGSGIDGEALRQKTNLEGEGFTVSSIDNADSSDYTDTIIKAKAEVDKDFITKLKTILSNSFTVGDTEILSEDSSVPVVVIIGTKN